MITATTWVPRGFAAPFPEKYQFDEDEYERISQLAKLQLDDAKEDLEEAQAEKSGTGNAKSKNHDDDDDDLKEYDLEHYDDEVDEAAGDTMAMFGNANNLVFHENDEDDPYITMQGADDEDDEEREELQILATDNLVLAGRIEDEVAHLEVYVYEDEDDNLYVHHDIMLPAIPLAVEWVDMPVGKSAASNNGKGNFVAIGTMDPDIELWNLDVVDSMYPDAVLGQGAEDAANADKPKKKKKKSKKANDDFHVDSVLSLAANRQHRNLLASSSADKTVKLWDLNTTKCAKSYTYHTDKVSSVAWHPVESTVLLSGSYDRTVVAADMRAPEAKAPRWGVESDVETVRWNPHDPNYFYVRVQSSSVNHPLTAPDLNRKRHDPLPRHPHGARRPLTVKTRLGPPSPRRIYFLFRHQPHHPRLPRHRLDRQASQALERASRGPQHGRLARPRRRARLLDLVRARQGGWVPPRCCGK